MSKFHPNSAKHKAQHCGYRGKPTKKAVHAIMDLYKNVSNEEIMKIFPDIKPSIVDDSFNNGQTKLDF